MKKLLLTSASVALLAAAQAQAALYEISYGYIQSSKYTSSKPLVGGVPDPGNQLNGSDPIIANHPGYEPVATNGTGWLDTTTGQIYLAPVDIEYNVVGGSYGYVGWSQTLNGSFSGNNFSMSGNATVNGGSMVCESASSTACTNRGGVGSAAGALLPSQTYPDPVTDEFGEVVTPGGPKTVVPVSFNFIGTGGIGQYVYQSDVQPAYEDTTINFTIGNIVPEVPVPAAAWLFGSGLLGLAGVGRKRR